MLAKYVKHHFNNPKAIQNMQKNCPFCHPTAVSDPQVNEQTFQSMGTRNHWPNAWQRGWQETILITAIDYAIRWKVAAVVKKHTESNVTRFIGREIISRFGKPDFLDTDGVKELTSNAVKIYLNSKEIEHSVVTQYHQKANDRLKQLNVH